jgi:hypothetical protein
MNIDQLESYNLGDAVKFNDKLNPKLWGSDEHLKPEIHSKLLEIAEDFRQFLGITDLQLKDITISGSNAAYTYTPHSDIDLHLVVDLPEADASEVYRELFDAKKYQYNDQHNIKIGGYDVELYVQDANRPHHSQGIYSVLRNDWIDVPKRRKTNIDDVSTRSKYKDLEQRIDQAVASDDYDVMSDLSAKIRELRQSGLDQHGEFGPENLAFKMLRSQGKIKQLYDARNRAKDQLLSLDERRKKKKNKVRYGYGAYWYPGTGYAGQDHAAGSEGGGGDGGGGESLRESADLSDEEILKDFVDFCVKELKIEHMPRVKLRKDPQWSVVNRTFGRYINDVNTLEVAFGQRHIMDVLRTVAHELTHKHQHERAAVPVDAGETGSPYENEANARAGVLMRDYGRLHPELFDSNETRLGEGASGYIPTKKQARDPRFSMALTVDIKPGQVGKEANKLGLKTNKQGQPQIARADGLFETLMAEYKGLNELALKSTLPVTQTMDHPAKQVYDMKTQSGEYQIVFGISNKDDNFDNDPDYDGPTGYLLDVLLLGRAPDGSWTQYNTNVGEKQVAQIFATIAQLAVKIIKAQPGIDEIEIKGADTQRSRIYSRLMQQNIDSLLPGWKLGGEGLVREKPQQAVAEVIKMPPVNMVFSNENLVDWAYNDAQKKQARQLQSLKTDVPTRVYDMGDHVRVFVMDEKGPVLYLALEKYLDGFKTNAVQIHPRGQGKNLAFKVYQAVSDTFQRPLYSDQTHTDASRLGIWKKLIDKFPDRLVGYDQATREDLPLTATDQGPVVRGKEPIYVQKKKKDLAKPVTPQTRSRTRLLKFLPATAKQAVTEDEDQQLDEVKMSPSALQSWAKSSAAQGIRAGFEAELIFRDTTNDDDDEGDMEPDYDYDERARSVSQVIDFFNGGDYGGLSDRQEGRLQDGLDEQYMEWQDERMRDAFDEEAEDLIRKVLFDEGDWDEDNEIQKQLALLDLTDDEINDIVNAGERAPKFTSSKEQTAYAEANPLYQKYLDAQAEAEGLLDDLVADEVRKKGANWDAALDDFRENFYVDDDSDFFENVGLTYMSDIAAEYSLDWPYLTGSGGGNNGGSREWDEIGSSLEKTVGMPVKVSSGYHNATRKEGLWIVEPDTSLRPDDGEDFGLEIVSPPMPLLQALEQLQAVTDWANSPYGSAYTNESTGLHMGVSVPYKGGDVDYLKLILFLGDEYVLQSFGREANSYTKSAMKKFRENIQGGRADPAGALSLMKSNLIEFAYREIQKGVGTGKYTSAHIQDGYIEFRSAGGDWLAEGDAEPGKLENTMLRYARAMQIAADPSAERKEFAKKLYKLVAPEGDSQLALFSQFAAGEIDKEQLKKQWAERTIGTERKTNQRWKLYDRATGEPVPGQEYNGYTEEEARARAKGKIRPGGSDRDFDSAYELRNMSGDQQWEVYDVNTGKTLEIVTGRNKGEAADAVFDKYAAQKIGFNVRPYQDPATMTPRAKLAKRITGQPRKPVDYNYEIVNQADVRLPVVDKFYATNDTDAQKVYSQWLKNKDLPDDTADYGYRKVAAKPAEEPPWVAQNFDSARDSATLQTNLQDRPTSSAQTVNRSWSNLDEYNWNITNRDTGETLYRINSANRQAAAEYALNYLRNQGLNSSDYQIVIAGAGTQTESIDPVSGAGAVPLRPVIKKISTDRAEPIEPVAKKQSYRSAIGQAISKRDLEDMTQQIKMARRLGDSVMEMEDTPPAVLHALDQAAQKNGYKNWADVKANPRSPQAVMNVAKLANTMLRMHQSSHDKMFEKAKLTTL